MIKCRECDADMSSKANACPKCGRVYRGQPLSAVKGLTIAVVVVAVFFGAMWLKFGG